MRTRTDLLVARVRKRLSQRELAAGVGVSQQTIAKWERGITTPSHFAHIRAMELALGEPAERLFPDIFRLESQ